MKTVKWTDEDGWSRLSLLNNETPDRDAPMGVPCNPPDLRKVNWMEVARKLNNELVDLRLINFRDLQRPQSGIEGTIVGCLLKDIIRLYKQEIYNHDD